MLFLFPYKYYFRIKNSHQYISIIPVNSCSVFDIFLVVNLIITVCHYLHNFLEPMNSHTVDLFTCNIKKQQILCHNFILMKFSPVQTLTGYMNFSILFVYTFICIKFCSKFNIKYFLMSQMIQKGRNVLCFLN